MEKHGTRHRDSEEDGVVLCACCPPGLQLGLCAPPRLPPEAAAPGLAQAWERSFQRGAGPLDDQSVHRAPAPCRPGLHIAFLPSPSVPLLPVSVTSFVCVCEPCPRRPFLGLL